MTNQTFSLRRKSLCKYRQGKETSATLNRFGCALKNRQEWVELNQSWGRFCLLSLCSLLCFVAPLICRESSQLWKYPDLLFFVLYWHSSIKLAKKKKRVSCFSVVFWPLILQLNKYWITSYVPQPFKVTVIETQKKKKKLPLDPGVLANCQPTSNLPFYLENPWKKLVANQLCENLSTATVRIIGQVLDSTVLEKKLWLKFQTTLQIWHNRARLGHRNQSDLITGYWFGRQFPFLLSSVGSLLQPVDFLLYSGSL